MHAQYGMRVPPQRLARVEREIMSRVRQVFDSRLAADFHSPHDVVRFVEMLFSEKERQAVGFPDGEAPRRFIQPLHRQLAHYLTSPALLRRAPD